MKGWILNADYIANSSYFDPVLNDQKFRFTGFSVAGNSELPVRLAKLLNARKNVSFLWSV